LSFFVATSAEKSLDKMSSLWVVSTFIGACIASTHFVVDDLQRHNALKTYRLVQQMYEPSEPVSSIRLVVILQGKQVRRKYSDR